MLEEGKMGKRKGLIEVKKAQAMMCRQLGLQSCSSCGVFSKVVQGRNSEQITRVGLHSPRAI